MNCLRFNGDCLDEGERPSLVLVDTSKRTVRKKRAKPGGGLSRIENLMLCASVVGVLWFGASTACDMAKHLLRAPAVSTAKISVAPGDTLWRIAGRVTPTNAQQIDIMNEIRALNPSVSSGETLFIGQTIVVPIATLNALSDVHIANSGNLTSKSM